MMDWTDRHCRFLHRQFTRRAMLYTEMVTVGAILHGDPERVLGYSCAEHPVALQIGGSEPELLARAVEMALPFGFKEINLNVGCPSDRVKSGAFGAVLMKTPDLVRDCVAAMRALAGTVPVTVKCRIGVDDQVPQEILPRFLEAVSAGGVDDVTIHARMAWLEGLSPKQNRDIPPLDYDLVMEMKARFPAMRIGINGGIQSLDQARGFLDRGLDHVMIGRAAYHGPADILLNADSVIHGEADPLGCAEEAVPPMLDYIEGELVRGTRLHAITRHMLGLFNGRPGARNWRRVLSEGATRKGAGPELVLQALGSVTRAAA